MISPIGLKAVLSNSDQVFGNHSSNSLFRVWSKYPNCMSLQPPAMMGSLYEEHQLCTSAGLCNGAGESGIAAPERVPDCGESDPASTSASSIADYRSGAVYLGGDWQATRSKSVEASRASRQARHHSRLVSPTHRSEVRR